MAWGIVPEPVEAGYCERGSCEHVDCADVWRLRDQRCGYCGDGLEAGDKFTGGPGREKHFACAIAEADAAAAARNGEVAV